MKTYHRVRMFDTDCANVIFFGSQFRYFHEAIEVLFDQIGVPFSVMFSTSPFLFVVVHASADFIKPLTIGDAIEIQTRLKEMGDSSCTLLFEMFREGTLVGRGEIVQVCLDAKARTKMRIPDSFREKVQNFLPQSNGHSS